MLARRRVLLLAAAPLAGAGCAASAVAPPFGSLATARQALQALADDTPKRGSWTLAQVLHHAAQSVEYSMQGFPQPKPAWFQATLGAAAFAVFSARGRMNHSLDEPIPGAPALDAAAPLPAARARLLRALQAFEAWDGPLRPHFAYGALDKAAYTQAHLMHLADHWTEIHDTPRRQTA